MRKSRFLTAGAIAIFVAAVAAIVLGSSGSGGDSPSRHIPARPKPRARALEPPARSKPEPASGGIEKAIWGPVRMPDGSSAFPIYKRLGVDVFQIQLRWPRVAAQRPANPVDPADPAYRWPAEVEEAIEEGKRYGIEVAVMVTRSPGWANGGRPSVYAPANPSDFAVFLTAAANRYPAVDQLDDLGRAEPGRPLPAEQARTAGRPARYAVLLDTAYRALKTVSRKEVVIGGMIFSGGEVRPPEFLKWLRLRDGRAPRLDWFGLNPYPFRFPDLAEEPVPGG